MSIEVMNAVWKHSKAEGRARLVLLAIADHQGEIGAWPSIATLSKMVNASERSVQRDISELVKLGELLVEVNSAPTKTQYKSNLYWVLLPGVTDPASGVTDQVDRGDRLGDSGVTTVGMETLNLTISKTLTNSDGKRRKLPSDFKPNQNHIAYASENGLDLNYQWLSFTDHVQANGKKYIDWDAAFRTWLRNAVAWKPKQATSKPAATWDWMNGGGQ
jgi:hypothetical protein